MADKDFEIWDDGDHFNITIWPDSGDSVCRINRRRDVELASPVIQPQSATTATKRG
jgi:hypothetical protein